MTVPCYICGAPLDTEGSNAKLINHLRSHTDEERNVALQQREAEIAAMNKDVPAYREEP